MRTIIISFFLLFSIVKVVASNVQWIIDMSERYVLVDSLGNKLSNNSYDFVYDFYDDSIVSVKKNGFWGVVNTQGLEIIPCEYDELYFEFYNRTKEYSCCSLKENFVIVCYKKKNIWVFDDKGNLLLEKVQKVRNLSYGNILYSKKKHTRIFSVMDRRSYKVEKKKKAHLMFSHFDENGICIVVHVFNFNSKQESYLFGAIDTKGRYVIPCIYKEEIEVMNKVGRTIRSFRAFNNK